MESLIQDFKMKKTSRMETLYQILSILQSAGLEEPVRQATLEEYTLYVDIIAAQQKGAEQRGLAAGGEPDCQEQ